MSIIKFIKRLVWWKRSLRIRVYRPNNNTIDCWREWLEDNVGKQGRTWDWRLYNSEHLELNFRNQNHASLFLMRWM